MSESKESNWIGQKVIIYLSTPLFVQADQKVHPMVLKADVVDMLGSGLVINIEKALNQQGQKLNVGAKKIFLPFSKVDYIAL